MPPMQTMSATAKQADAAMQVKLYPVKKIYADPIFNCRGPITPFDVIDLARDIAENGLCQPIIIAPRRINDPAKYDYVVIAGHRRLKAYEVNGQEEVPAILRLDLDEFKARILNIGENLKRNNLNMLQEAKALQPFKDAGFTREMIAGELGMSPGWVQVRLILLDLPDEIQVEAAAGIFSQQQIRDLHGIKDKKHQMDQAKIIKEAKEKSDGKKVAIAVAKPGNPSVTRNRKKPEILAMMEVMKRAFDGYNIATSALAWASGGLSDLEFHEEIKKYCDEQGLTYVVPHFDN